MYPFAFNIFSMLGNCEGSISLITKVKVDLNSLVNEAEIIQGVPTSTVVPFDNLI